jgi:hypothetical protein
VGKPLISGRSGKVRTACWLSLRRGRCMCATVDPGTSSQHGTPTQPASQPSNSGARVCAITLPPLSPLPPLPRCPAAAQTITQCMRPGLANGFEGSSQHRLHPPPPLHLRTRAPMTPFSSCRLHLQSACLHTACTLYLLYKCVHTSTGHSVRLDYTKFINSFLFSLLIPYAYIPIAMEI